MTPTLLADVHGVEAEFAVIAARIGPAVTARIDPFSEPDYERFEDEDEDGAVDEDDPAIDWP
ncbi:hypothetical protein [Streptomonospora sp. PA3]|uniref:hypothetical protein n=1 Tax=Streptomonospora sp. PA3 TaxID=2607326 RepID=UPI0012DFADB8|nr:hypothetical protein [Streptomonospora sp. PA3]